MKPTTPVVWILLAVVAAGLLLLVDPLSRFDAEPVEETLPGPTPPAETARRADVAPAPEVAPDAGPEGTPRDGASGRRAVDPLLGEGLAAFHVVRSGGRPVVGAQILVVRNGTPVDDGTTDAGGKVRFPGDGRPAGLLVAAECRPLEWHDVVLDPGRHEILLATGGRVAGRFVREDGRPAGALPLGIESDHPLSSIPPLPAAVEDALGVTPLREGYAVVKTDEEGGFELTGLPAAWSGRLWLRSGWKVVSTSHGDIEPQARGIRLAAPASDLVVCIAPHRSLYGRLVLRNDGSPLGGAQLSAMLRSPDAKAPEIARAETDGDGRFEFSYQEERISTFDLHLGGRFHRSSSILALEGASLPPNGDLGDVVVDGVRHVPFLVRDRPGRPVAGAVAAAAGSRSAPTGTDGRGEFRWLPRAVERMAVQARGFVPAEVAIPPVVAEPLVVTLEPANELAVTLLLPEGADPRLFRVVLRAEERITAAPLLEGLDQEPHVSEWTFPPVALLPAAPGTFLCAQPDPQEARVTFFALRPGVEIELEVHGIGGGDAVYHREALAPFFPTERRALEVALVDTMIAFRGRVLDENGTPLVRASLQLTNQILGWTDEEGAFLCFLTAPETGTLLIQHRACATKYVPDYTVPTDGRPVEFRLRAARSVTIEVVDENGAPMPRAEVWTEYGGFLTNTHRIEGNRHVASSVPDAPFVLLARLAGREYRQEHDPAVREARIVVPVHGRVTAIVATASTATRTGSFDLLLIPEGDDSARPVVESRDAAPDLRIEIPLVLPGPYRAVLSYTPAEEERRAGAGREESKPVEIIVEAGRETRIRLALPAAGGG